MNVEEPRDATAIAFGDALISLLAEKNLDQITVTELAKQAGFSRKTFYARYSTVVDVMDELQQAMRRNTGSIADLPDFAIDSTVIPNYLRRALDKAGTGPQSVQLMKYNLAVFDFYSNMLADSLFEQWTHRYAMKRDRLRMYADAVVAGMEKICQEWALMKRPLPIDELCDFLEFYLRGAFAGLEQGLKRGADGSRGVGYSPDFCDCRTQRIERESDDRA